MFGQRKSRGHGKSKKGSNNKKNDGHNWMDSKKKKKQEANLFAVIMSSGDPPPPAQTSISTTSFDVLDDARYEKVLNTSVTSQSAKHAANVTNDADAIEEAVPIVKTTLPMPESEPKIEKNGIDLNAKATTRTEPDDECLINCIYYAQQCCECTIV